MLASDGNFLPPWQWCLAAIGIGGIHLGYLIRCLVAGMINVGKPGRDYRRSDDPFNYWGYLILFCTFSGTFFTIGLIGLVRQIYWHCFR